MRARNIVGDLSEWELPALEKEMEKLVDSIRMRKITVALDDETLGEALYARLFDRILKLGQTAANEAITGWMQGVADGKPDLCVDMPYLRGDQTARPLSVAYSVGACDGSRLELHRADLAEVFEGVAGELESGASTMKRVAAVATGLRQLADQLEADAAEDVRE